MPSSDFRLFFDTTAATQDQLDMVEDISVDQEIDTAWEARIKIALMTDDQGSWKRESESVFRAFTQVRVEVRMGDADFVPLIEGPVVRRESHLSAQPGESALTLIVHDASVMLNRSEEIMEFQQATDDEIATQIFGNFPEIASTDIDTVADAGSGLDSTIVKRGTAMQVLRRLARRNGMYAYVLPGDTPGSSIGCFKALADAPGSLPPLVLTGADRTIEELTVSNDAQRPATYSGSALLINDSSTTSGTASASDATLLGDVSSAEQSSSASATRLLPPQYGESVALDSAAQALAFDSALSIEARGVVREGVYGAALTPYNVVTVQASATEASGDYLIWKVVHAITRSSYTQTFKLRRNALSSVQSGASAVPNIF